MELINLQSARISVARESKKVMMTQAVEYGNDPETPINLDMMENEIYEATYKASIYPSINLTDAEKTENGNSWHTYRERMYRIEKKARTRLLNG